MNKHRNKYRVGKEKCKPGQNGKQIKMGIQVIELTKQRRKETGGNRKHKI